MPNLFTWGLAEYVRIHHTYKSNHINFPDFSHVYIFIFIHLPNSRKFIITLRIYPFGSQIGLFIFECTYSSDSESNVYVKSKNLNTSVTISINFPNLISLLLSSHVHTHTQTSSTLSILSCSRHKMYFFHTRAHSISSANSWNIGSFLFFGFVFWLTVSTAFLVALQRTFSIIIIWIDSMCVRRDFLFRMRK